MLGNKIKERRELLGISQTDLAEALGTSQNQVSRYERGASDPTSEMLLKLASALGTSPNWLTGFGEDEANSSGLDEEELELLLLYRAKSPESKQKIRDVVRVL